MAKNMEITVSFSVQGYTEMREIHMEKGSMKWNGKCWKRFVQCWPLNKHMVVSLNKGTPI